MNASARVDAVVVPDSHLIYDIIVGRDFLEQEHIFTIKRGYKLIVGQLPVINTKYENIVDVNFADLQTHDTVNINVESEEAESQCTDLIREFRDCIALSIKELRKTEATSLSIRCTTDVPVVYRPYRLSEAKKQIVRDIIQELLANGIIRESKSPNASPIILVRKKSGEHRMCIDYRKLN